MQTHVHPHSHCGRTLSISEPSRKYSNARTRSDTEKVWKWEQKKLRSVGERVKWNDRDVGGEPRVWQWSWRRSPTHVLTPSKPPVHPSATTCIYQCIFLINLKKKCTWEHHIEAEKTIMITAQVYWLQVIQQCKRRWPLKDPGKMRRRSGRGINLVSDWVEFWGWKYSKQKRSASYCLLALVCDLRTCFFKNYFIPFSF